MGAELGPLFLRPSLPVAVLHEEGHKSLDLDHFRQKTLAFPFLQVPQQRKRAEKSGSGPSAHGFFPADAASRER